MFNWYKKCLQTYPYFSRMMTAGTIFSSFDLFTQTYIEQRQSYDYKKIATNFTVGFAAAPWIFVWFSKLQPKIIDLAMSTPTCPSIIGPIQKKVCFKQLSIKVVSDYFLCFPMMQVLYHTGFNLIYNQNVQSIKQAFKTKVNYSLQKYHNVWPAVCFLNHLIIPPYLRAPFVQISAASWNGYVNYIFPKIQGQKKLFF